MNATDAGGASASDAPSADQDAGRTNCSLPALNTFLVCIGAGACIWDADLRLVAWNSAYRKIQAIPDHILKPGARLADILHTVRGYSTTTGPAKNSRRAHASC